MLKYKTECIIKERTVAIRRTKNTESRDFPDGPMAKTLHTQCWECSSIPGQGTRSHMPQLKSPHAAMKT